MLSKKDIKKTILLYCLGFIFLAGYVVFECYRSGYTLINNNDGYRQDYRALIYFYDYVKEFLHNLFINHKLVFNEWDFSIGEGSSVLQSVGITFKGPFIFLCLFFDENHLYLAHDLIAIVRIFACGLSFIYLCINKQKDNLYGIVSGALIYVFSLCSLSRILTNYNYIMPLMMLPLVIVGCDKIFENKKPYVLVLSVFLTSVYDFYQFYQVALTVVLYVVIKCFFIKGNIKEKLLLIVKIGFYSILGVLMSAIVLLPSLDIYIGNSRVGANSSSGLMDWIYRLRGLAESYICFDFTNTAIGGYTSIGLLSIVLLFKKHQNKFLMLITAMAFLACGSSVVYSVYNAMSYPSDRWFFLLTLILSYVVTDCFDYFDRIDNTDLAVLFIFVVIYFVYCFRNSNESRFNVHVLMLILTIGLLFFVRFAKEGRIKTSLISLSIIGTLFFNMFYYLSPYSWNYISHNATIEQAKNVLINENVAINDLSDDSFYRYSCDYYDRYNTNSSINTDNHSTNFYWSEVNSYISDFRKELGLLDHNSFHFDDYDDRSVLNLLADVKYLVVEDEETIIPEGYEHYGNIDGYDVYKTNYNLPLIYGYKNVMPLKEFEELTLIEKQEALLNYAITENDMSNANFEGYETLNDCSIIDQNNIEINDNKIIAGGDGAYITYRINCVKGEELYLSIDGLNANINSDETIIEVQTSDGKMKEINHKTSSHIRYADRNEYIVYLGIQNNDSVDVTLFFNNAGDYSYEQLEFASLDFNEELNNINKLNNIDINSLNVTGDIVEANISLNEDEYVCLSIPYSNGWKTYVDGKEVEMNRTNIMYMGFNLGEGTHDVKLVFETPYLRIGALISLFSTAGFVLLILNDKKHRLKVQ